MICETCGQEYIPEKTDKEKLVELTERKTILTKEIIDINNSMSNDDLKNLALDILGVSDKEKEIISISKKITELTKVVEPIKK